MPDECKLDCADLQRDILHNTANLPLFPEVRNILHPTKSKPGQTPHDNQARGRNHEKEDTGLTFDKHNDRDLVKSKEFFKQVIQKYGLHLGGVPKPMYNMEKEECGKYMSIGVCNSNCKPCDTHVPPTGAQKGNLKKFQEDCLGRYKANGGRDFQ